MIRLVGISKIYDEGRPNAYQALNGIDLEIEPLQVTVFTGPNGSGKTTLLSIIGAMARPTAGRVHLNGREITSLPERFTAQIRRRTFGFVFQNYHLIKGLSVLDNVMIPAYPEGWAPCKLNSRAQILLEKFNLTAKKHQKVELLSGGEQQRTAIVRALINDPAVIIADEPTAHLDSESAQTFLAIVGQLKSEGRTVLMASHDPLVYRSDMVDRRVALHDGRLRTAD